MLSRSARGSLPQMTSPSVRRPAAALLGLLALGALAGCGAGAPAAAHSVRPLQTAEADPAASPEQATAARPLSRPGLPATVAPLSARLRPDVMVTAAHPLSAGAIHKLAALSPAHGSAVFRAGRVRIAGHVVRAVAVDPSTFRRFAAQGTAETTAVWLAVARGQAVTSHAVAKGLKLPLGKETLAAPMTGGAPSALRVGAYATTGIPGTDLIVGDDLGKALGLPAQSGMLLTAGAAADPVSLAGQVRDITGAAGSVDLLTPPAADPVAFLTGSDAAKAFGAFSYRYFPDGTLQPDPRWVAENIVTETVPIFGSVTCHRLMMPQLRGALTDIVAAGLGSTLHTYDGCYVPKYIERSPTHAISLHTWGIAIDLDASTNYRGIRGTMDPKVVEIFKRWGFRWGGDWHWTDPMHFELAALLSSPR